jgi:hypothetical protein
MASRHMHHYTTLVHTKKKIRSKLRRDAVSLTLWVENFNRLLTDKGSTVKAALNWMEEGGCDLDLVFNLLPECTPKPAPSMLRLRLKNDWSQMIRRAERLRKQIARTQACLRAAQTDRLSPILVALDSKLFSDELPLVLDSSSNWLNDSKIGIPALRRVLDSRKIPSQLAFYALCRHVEKTIPPRRSRYIYEHLANLLEAGKQAQGFPYKTIDPESVKRQVRRFKQKHPDLWKAPGLLSGGP